MTPRRRTEGRETWSRLREWDRGSTSSERLASHILRVEGFKENDPSHPLGGPDGLKDIICDKGGKTWVGAAYFPNGQQNYSAIKKKFLDDLNGAISRKVHGFAFITNQELKLSVRKKVQDLSDKVEIEIFHLERISSILDSTPCYGIRLEYLDIEMSKEEQIAFISWKESQVAEQHATLKDVITLLQSSKIVEKMSSEQLRKYIPLKEIKEFKSILNTIAGYSEGYDPYSMVVVNPLRSYAYGLGGLIKQDAHIRSLHVPLEQLKEFRQVLKEIVDLPDPFGLQQAIYTGPGYGVSRKPVVSDLVVPLNALKEYEKTLDRIITKLEKKRALE